MVGAFAYTNMMAIFKENKGSSVWNYLNTDNLVSFIFIIRNHKDSWVCAFDVTGMAMDEQEKYTAHKPLGTPKERKKYAHITRRGESCATSQQKEQHSRKISGAKIPKGGNSCCNKHVRK